MAGCKIHEGRHWCLAEFSRAPERNLILAIQFECEQAGGFLRHIAGFEVCGFEKG